MLTGLYAFSLSCSLSWMWVIYSQVPLAEEGMLSLGRRREPMGGGKGGGRVREGGRETLACLICSAEELTWTGDTAGAHTQTQTDRRKEKERENETAITQSKRKKGEIGRER